MCKKIAFGKNKINLTKEESSMPILEFVFILLNAQLLLLFVSSTHKQIHMLAHKHTFTHALC
jgi:hypothetical protein